MTTMRMLALALLFVFVPAAAEDEPWALLRQGGHVVLMRHTVTTPGVGDPEGFRLADCTTQRNLSEEGKEHAKRIGEAFREFNVPIEAIYSSPWCRCVETAGLAFGRGAEVWPALSNLFGRPENRQKQVDELSARIGAWKGKGNLVLVTHGSTMLALARISPQTGEMVILAPRGEGRFAVAARLTVR
ncbi:MAG: histidine phosphatase family protein [Betaproteobacteria bacterium]